MIRFSKYLWVYFLISSLVLVPGMIALLVFGLKPSIDFTGGTLWEIKFTKPVPMSVFENVSKEANVPLASIQPSGAKTYILRVKPQGADKLSVFQTAVVKKIGEMPLVVREESVGPILGKELLQKAVVAAVIAIAAILLYVAYAFANLKFGISAVIALFHDLLVVLGVFSLLGKFFHVEVDTLFVTAFLTTMSFSVHDTIVVFDRIREYLKKGERLSFEQLCDKALTETIGRSLTNSLTIIFMLLALVLMGGESIRWFIVALLVGTISGTYSSPFIATPILILWDRWEKRNR